MRTVQPDKKKAQMRHIVAAAARRFSLKGIDGTTTDEICEEAGISPGRLYYYFSSRDAVIEAVVEYVYEIVAVAQLEMETCDDMIDALIAGHRLADAVLDEAGIRRALLVELVSTGRTDLQKVVHEKYATMNANIETMIVSLKSRGKFSEAAEPRKLASVILSILTGWEVLAVTDKAFDIEQAGAALRAVLEPWYGARGIPADGQAAAAV